MREIKKVLTTVNYNEAQLQKLKSFFDGSEFVHLSHADSEGIAREIKDADVVILPCDLDDRFLQSPSVKWIHCDHAGLNKSARPEVFKKGIILTGSAGRSAPVLAEHCVYFMLLSCYHTKDFLKAQENHEWGVDGQENLRGLFGRTVGIIGFGNNGRMLAERLHAFGMDIIAYDRNPIEGFDYLSKKLCSEKGDTLDYLYENSDFVVLCIALSDETHHLINKEAFSKMKKGVTLVNMARGGVVDTKALIEAIKNKTVACAGLDVFEDEPLGKGSELWDMKEVYITPHCTPQVPDRTGRSIEIIGENVRRYKAEEPMLNRVSAKDVNTSAAMSPERLAEMKAKYLESKNNPDLDEKTRRMMEQYAFIYGLNN